MADTGEGREIKARSVAKEAEVVAESKKLLLKAVTATDQTLRRRRRVNTKGTLPVAPAPDGKEFTMAESRNKRVLIVDNNEEESKRLGAILQRAGYDSMATWSGLEALELMKAEEYDILLVSSYLPDVYVGDFFERLKRLPVRPCSIVMQEGCTPAATLREVQNVVGEEESHAG